MGLGSSQVSGFGLRNQDSGLQGDDICFIGVGFGGFGLSVLVFQFNFRSGTMSRIGSPFVVRSLVFQSRTFAWVLETDSSIKPCASGFTLVPRSLSSFRWVPVE